MPTVGAANYGNTGLLGQTTVPKAPDLSGTWNPTTRQFNLSAVLKQLQDSQTQANQANVQRYNDLLQSISNLSGQVVGAGGTYGQAMDMMNQVGQAAQTRIAQHAQQQSAANQQSLISKGLGNTTVGVNLEQQTQQQAEQARQQSEEGLAQQKAGILQNQAGAQLAIGGMQQSGIQSLNQQAPNMALYTEMLKQAGESDAARQAKADQAAAQASAKFNQGSAEFKKSMGIQGSGGGGGGGGGTSMGGGLSTGGGGGGGEYAPTGSTYTPGPTGGGAPVQGGGFGMSTPGGTQWENLGGSFPNLADASGGGAAGPEFGEHVSGEQLQGMSDEQINKWAGLTPDQSVASSEAQTADAMAAGGDKPAAGGGQLNKDDYQIKVDPSGRKYWARKSDGAGIGFVGGPLDPFKGR